MIHGKEFTNGESIELERVPVIQFEELRKQLTTGDFSRMRRVALFALPGKEQQTQLFLIVSSETDSRLRIVSANVVAKYPSLTVAAGDLHLFERELYEQLGLEPTGHPWLKPVRFQRAYAPSDSPTPTIGRMPFFRVHGEEEHEVAVGPVHAGIIEPGHFRFQCHGETVHHLEISLGYQHRGIEPALLGGPHKQSLFQIEAAAGDTTVAHSWAYCQNLESLTKTKVPERAQYLRAIALELERLANHTGDLGALAQDVGYLPTSSYCGRIRGDLLNITALICGSRLGRNMIRPGGVVFDLDQNRQAEVKQRLEAAETDLESALDLMFEAQSVMARFENIGIVSKQQAQDLGLLGPAARASGVLRDVRSQYPTTPYNRIKLKPALGRNGSVLGRAQVRRQEVIQSLNIIRTLLAELPSGSTSTPINGALRANSLAVSLVEGWRGEVKHIAVTNEQGLFSSYKIIDPSFQNWTGLALALRGQQISDFPLCNKSFNLSYCGFDL